MHSLNEFLRELGPTPARDAFLRTVRKLMGPGSRVSLQYLRHIVAKRKSPSIELCVAIERASMNFVRCETLRPDFVWAYVASRPIADGGQRLAARPSTGGARRLAPRRPAANQRKVKGS